jgi:LysM repeat protein
MLVVPEKGAGADLRRLPIMYAPPIPAPAPRRVAHTVRPGETLGSIAARYRVSIEDLRRWNRIGRLAVGQKLMIQTRAGTSKGRPVQKVVKGKPKVDSKKKLVRRSDS